MNWTHKIPKTPGWYWFREYPSWHGTIKRLLKDKDGKIYMDDWTIQIWRKSHSECQWSDRPIPEPE